MAEDQDTTRRLERARILIVSPDFNLGQRVQTELSSECYSVVMNDRKVLSSGLTFDLVVLVLVFDCLAQAEPPRPPRPVARSRTGRGRAGSGAPRGGGASARH